jgi:enediyne biosynthesis protein E4
MKTKSHPKPQAALGRQRSVPQDVPPHPTRKRTLGVLLMVLLTVAGLWSATAEVTFTRVTEGDIATETGDFSGCAWGDYDGDGHVDLFVTGEHTSRNTLYRNNGDGTFTRITIGAIASDPITAVGAAWADYDNDGDLDLFVTSEGINEPNRLYRNDGDSVFTRITEGAWVNDLPSACMGPAWGDYDNDGLLDLFISNTWNLPNFLYRNCGNGTTTPIGGIITTTGGGVSHGCTWADYDNDGDLDLFVSGQVNMMFRNNGDGSFTLITTGAPVTAGYQDLTVVAGDYDNDGDLDLIVSNGQGINQLWRNDGPDGFVSVTEVNSILRSAGSGAAAWGDYDNDGYLDLFIANLWRRDNSLFRNNGDGTFTKVTEGAVVNDGGRSWGCAWADYDNDGYLDLIVVNRGYDDGYALPTEPVFLYRNNGGPNHWLILRLVGVVSNRSAIGAKVRVLATIRGQTCWQMREICGGTWNQNDLRAHFGLGDAESADTVLIEWPSGVTQVLKNVPANQHLVIEEDPIPRVALSFSEGGGLKTRNFGSLAHAALLTQPDGSPAYSLKVPTGSWAPPNNVAAIDFGVIAEGQAGRAIDCRGELGPLDAFTICGWLNARDLRTGEGGNRIICVLAAPDGPGLELVQQSDGSLQLGVNQTANGPPVRSTSNRITEDPEAAPENWVFFAVTYDGTHTTDNAQFFFGTPEEPAEPDSAAMDYERGTLSELNSLTVGNVSAGAHGRHDIGPKESRVFRGLLDEMELFHRVLTLEEIQQVQRAPAPRAVGFEPQVTVRIEGSELVFEWGAARPFQVQVRSAADSGSWRLQRGMMAVDGFHQSLRVPFVPLPGQRFYRLSDQ